MPSQIRRISFSDFRRHMASEMKFVSHEMGHLWLFQHGRPRGVVIPMRDEAVFHRAVGLNPREAFHRAMVDCDRRVSAIRQKERWVSEEMMCNLTHGYPPCGMDDDSYRRWRAMGPRVEGETE